MENAACPSIEISAYIDGELEGDRQRRLESHISECSICAEELNSQKQFLLYLDTSLGMERDIDLPEGFTRSVIANAEANVAGLRRPSEIYHTLFVCAAVILFVLFAAGTNTAELLNGIYGVVDKFAVVAGFFGHLVYDLFLGIAIVLRSFASQFRLETVMAVLIAMILFVPAVFISRKMLRVGRA
jgi:hypothetical protein